MNTKLIYDMVHDLDRMILNLSKLEDKTKGIDQDTLNCQLPLMECRIKLFELYKSYSNNESNNNIQFDKIPSIIHKSRNFSAVFANTDIESRMEKVKNLKANIAFFTGMLDAAELQLEKAHTKYINSGILK